MTRIMEKAVTAPVTLERALVYLAIIAGISAIPVIVLLMLR